MKMSTVAATAVIAAIALSTLLLTRPGASAQTPADPTATLTPAPQPTASPALTPPAGNEARLRLEVVDPSITCDGHTHAVRVWLDDLPSLTPSPAATPAPTGVDAFEFALHYDTAVVTVRDKSDVQLNPALDEAPPHSDVPRHFTGVSFIDNALGYTYAGGIALGLPAEIGDPAPGSIKTPLPWPTGVDPVAAGAPVLLMTFGLSAVGSGTTQLAVDRTDLFVGGENKYTSLDVASVSITVTGGCPSSDAPPVPEH
jgi:hypothetical protein